MKPKWLIQKDVFNEGNPEKMRDLILSKGMECTMTKYVPFEGGKYDYYDKNDCVIAYGSVNLIRQLRNEKPWIPTAWCNLTNLRCSDYYAHFGKYLLQQEYSMFPFGELKRKENQIFHFFGADDQIFIRPNDNVKSFDGELVSRSSFQEWCVDTEQQKRPSLESLVVVSRPQGILAEWRFVVCEKEVLTGSQYRLNNKLDVSSRVKGEAFAYAVMVAEEKWQPDSMYVLDICETIEGFRLIEIGSFNCAGLYDCDLEIVVHKASELALKEWTEVNE